MSNHRPMGKHYKQLFDYLVSQGHHPADIAHLPMMADARRMDERDYAFKVANAKASQIKFEDEHGNVLTEWPTHEREMEAIRDPLYKTSEAYRDACNVLTMNSTHRDHLIGAGKAEEAMNGGPNALLDGARRDALMEIEKEQVKRSTESAAYRYNLMTKLSDPNSEEAKLAKELDVLKRGHRPIEDALKASGAMVVQVLSDDIPASGNGQTQEPDPGPFDHMLGPKKN